MPKVVDHKLRYRELGKVAAFAMAELGPDKLTFAELAKRAKCSVGAVTYYVKSKDEILLMAGNYITLDAFERAAAIKTRYSGLKALRQILLGNLPCNAMQAQMADIMFRLWSKAHENMEIRNALHQGYQWAHHLIEQMIEEAQAAGELPYHLDPLKTARKTIAHMDGLTVLIRVSKKEPSAKEQRDYVDDWIEVLAGDPLKTPSRPKSSTRRAKA